MAQGSLVHRGPGEHSDWHAWRVSLLLYERAYCRFPIGSCSDQFVKFFEHRPKPKIRSARLKAPGIRDCQSVQLSEFWLHEAARCVQDYSSNIDDGMCVVQLQAASHCMQA